jgi:hypothetical protein
LLGRRTSLLLLVDDEVVMIRSTAGPWKSWSTGTRLPAEKLPTAPATTEWSVAVAIVPSPPSKQLGGRQGIMCWFLCRPAIFLLASCQLHHWNIHD